VPTNNPIPIDRIYIPIGTTFQKSWPLTDGDTGLAADPTGWAARCEVRSSYGGALVTRFHSNGSWDGAIAFDSAGNMTLTLPAGKTAQLTPMENGVFDVELIDPLGQPWRVVQGYAHVTPEATTDA
jgi:hypothetical protein